MSRIQALFLSALFLLGACVPAISNPAKEAAVMIESDGASVANNPQLSAEEIGRRFIRMLEEVESRAQLSLDLVKEVTGLTLQQSDRASFYSYSQVVDQHWSYTLTYVPEAPAIQRGVGLRFSRAGTDAGDAGSICKLDFAHYRDALIALGYREVPIPGEIGQVDEWRYYKGDITLSVIPMNAIPGQAGRLCVSSIGTLN